MLYGYAMREGVCVWVRGNQSRAQEQGHPRRSGASSAKSQRAQAIRIGKFPATYSTI